MDNNQLPSYLYGWGNNGSIDPSTNLYETLLNYNNGFTQPQQQLQQPIQTDYTGQYRTQGGNYQPPATGTTPIINFLPTVNNNLTTTGYGHPYLFTNDARNNSAPQYPPASSFWNQTTSLTPLLPGLQNLLDVFQMLSIRTPAQQYSTAPPNILGQATPYFANFENASTLPNPFRLAETVPRPDSPMPMPTPPPRLRRQLPRATPFNKVIKKKIVQQKLLIQNHFEAPLLPAPILMPSLHTPVLMPSLLDVYPTPTPEPFDTPGECKIERVENGSCPLVERWFKDVEEELNKNDDKEDIDVEK